MLIELKAKCVHGEFMANYARIGNLKRDTVDRLMRLAAKVGAMLIELKAKCVHGEFTSKLTSVSGLKVR